MISLKRYLDNEADPSKDSTGNGSKTGLGSGAGNGAKSSTAAEEKGLYPVAMGAYRSALLEMGNCSLDACPALGDGFKRQLQSIEEKLFTASNAAVVEASEGQVREQLREWGQRTAQHYRQKTGEVKEILIVMAQTAESVGARDQRCAQQITDVTTRLKNVANLEDLSQIRLSIQSSAAELKTSIDRMTAEGKEVIAQLRAEVSNYQVKLEEAEHVASSDSLTGLRNRFALEGQIERRLSTVLPFCVAIIDINSFKQVNDEHGHLAGDELLKQFSAKLTSVCRSTDLIGRWGGDEFILLLSHCDGARVGMSSLSCSMGRCLKPRRRSTEFAARPV